MPTNKAARIPWKPERGMYLTPTIKYKLENKTTYDTEINFIDETFIQVSIE